MNTEERWVNANQVAGQIAVNKDSIYRGIDEKEFPPFKVGRLLKLKLSEGFDGVEAKPSADVYSLGKIIVFLLTGQTDVDHVTFPAWRQLIQQCVSKDPSKRPELSVMKEALEEMPI